MKPIGLVIIALLILSGCATTSVTPVSQIAQDEATLETRRAAHYLTVLREKKNRFWESQGIEERYQPEGAAGEVEAIQTVSMAYRPLSECDRIVYSDWGASVLYGQSFLGYENYVNTVARCYSR